MALMTGDYAKAHDVGNRLLTRNRNDADVIKVLNILKQKNQHGTFLISYSIPHYPRLLFAFNIIDIEECEKLSSIDSSIEFDNECGKSDVTDGKDADIVDDNTDSRIDPRTRNKIVSHDISRLNIDKANTNFNFKQRMHRVIPIKVNKVLDK
ncbi:uncharacterized protein [Anoplolepis gracilipes]|uniref:uncharacterized protein n=1 Tax=Anoplolepis gracilipes TaxID=354296 RepID=UPI003BA322F4